MYPQIISCPRHLLDCFKLGELIEIPTRHYDYMVLVEGEGGHVRSLSLVKIGLLETYGNRTALALTDWESLPSGRGRLPLSAQTFQECLSVLASTLSSHGSLSAHEQLAFLALLEAAGHKAADDSA